MGDESDTQVAYHGAAFSFARGAPYAVTQSDRFQYRKNGMWHMVTWRQPIGDVRHELAPLVAQERWAELDVLLALLKAQHG